MTFSMKSASYEFSARDAVFSCLFAKYQIINSSNIIQTRGMLSGDEWKQDNTSQIDCMEGGLCYFFVDFAQGYSETEVKYNPRIQ